jgi:uncharacterized protein (DUF2336 family)
MTMGVPANEKKWWRRLPGILGRADIIGILEGSEARARAGLGKRTDMAPEVLYFLASEGDPETRRAVAANLTAPAHANRRLADDTDDDVRAELARKIGRLLPSLPEQAGERARALTLETLDCLARDQLPRVRQILAEEIKALDCVPKDVIRRLSRDVEKVAAPILEFSPLLSDADLIEILTTAHANYAVRAIAARRPLRADVSDAIAAARDVPAIAILLDNADALIREKTLERIAEGAETIKDWRRPLAMRHDLTPRLVRRIAGFVSAALIERLAARNNIDEDTRRHLAREMQARLAEAAEAEEATKAAAKAAAEIEQLFKEGKLDDDFVERAAEAGKRESVTTALAWLAGVSQETAKRIIESRSAKPVISLVWRAGLSMRTAFKVQSLALRLPASEILPARDGVHFPMGESEMRWHLGYFGVRA